MTVEQAEQVARKMRREYKKAQDWVITVGVPGPWDHPMEDFFVGMFNNVTHECRVQEDAS